MRFIVALGAGLLALSGTFIISNSVSATEGSTVIESTVVKPSQSELRTAINRIENIENYAEYSRLTAQELAATTDFYREYTYLFELAAVANALEANYDLIPAEELSAIISATENAETTCGYIFGTKRKIQSIPDQTTPTTSQATTPTQAQTTPVTDTPAQKASSSPTITLATTTLPTSTSTSEPVAETPTSAPELITETISETHTPSETASIAVPATGAAEKSNKPFFITLSAVALACFLIGSMIILNRKKSYRPGRKF